MNWDMFAGVRGDRLEHVSPFRRYPEAHGDQEIISVSVTEVDHDDDSGTHWGWMNSERVIDGKVWSDGDTHPCMIYDRFMLLEMCFPYGLDSELARDKGRVLRLRVDRQPHRLYVGLTTEYLGLTGFDLVQIPDSATSERSHIALYVWENIGADFDVVAAAEDILRDAAADLINA